MLRKYLLTVVLLVIGLTASFAQIFEPVKWDYAVRDLGNSEYELVFKATIDDNWHLYSQFIDDGGPIPTSFGFDSIPELELIGPVEEHGELETDFDPNFEMKLKWFSHEAEFVQKVKINADNLKFNGYYEFMTCDDKRCLPPEYVEMEFKLGADGMTITERELEPVGPVDTDSSESGNPFVNAKVDLTNPVNDCGEKREEKTLWGIFILGLIGGFIALLTPCVFPMIPLTVSYFTKGSGDKKAGCLSLHNVWNFLSW